MANILSIVTNLAIGVHGKKGTKLTTPIEFMPNWDGTIEYKPKTQTVEEQKAILMAFAKNQNAKSRREDDRTRLPVSKTKKKP